MGIVNSLPIHFTAFCSGTLVCGAFTVAILQFFIPFILYVFTPYYFQEICGCMAWYSAVDPVEKFLNETAQYHVLGALLPAFGAIIFLIGVCKDRKKAASFFIYMMVLFLIHYILFCAIQLYFLSFSKIESTCTGFPFLCYVTLLCVVIVYFYFLIIIKSFQTENMCP